MSKLYVYLPCYNEQENIAPLIQEWESVSEELSARGYTMEVVAVDDKSTDRTLEILREIEKEKDFLRVICHEVNQNLGGALLTSVKNFAEVSSDGDFMCFMDADNTHKPVFVFDMLDKIRDKDCVIASRYQPGAEIVGVPKNRLTLSDGAKLYYSMVLGVPGVKDYTCGYRLYRREIIVKALNKYSDNLIQMKTFSCMMELLYKLHLCGCKFGEVPFTLRYDDKGGTSKMKILRTVYDSLTVALKLRFKR